MDIISVAQRRQQEQIEQTLASRPPASVGRTHCADPDCGKAIALVRQQLGAQLCIDCQMLREQEARRWAPRGQG